MCLSNLPISTWICCSYENCKAKGVFLTNFFIGSHLLKCFRTVCIIAIRTKNSQNSISVISKGNPLSKQYFDVFPVRPPQKFQVQPKICTMWRLFPEYLTVLTTSFLLKIHVNVNQYLSWFPTFCTSCHLLEIPRIQSNPLRLENIPCYLAKVKIKLLKKLAIKKYHILEKYVVINDIKLWSICICMLSRKTTKLISCYLLSFQKFQGSFNSELETVPRPKSSWKL